MGRQRATHCSKCGGPMENCYLIGKKQKRYCRVCYNAKRRAVYAEEKLPPLYVRPKPYEADPNDPDVQRAQQERARFLRDHPEMSRHMGRAS